MAGRKIQKRREPPPDRQANPRRWTWWILLALVAATVIVYAPVRHYEFVNFDDVQYVSENPAVTAGLTGQGARWAFTTGHAGNWHPLTWLSHMLDVELFGLNAGRHHLTSVVLHLATTLLLFVLLTRMTGAPGRSGFVAGLFALHPLHVESVAWVAERKDVLSTFFLALTLLAYVHYVRRPGRARYFAVFVLFACGLMAKPMLVTLPFLLLLLDFWPLRRMTSTGSVPRLITEKLPLLALAIASSVVTFVMQRHARAVQDLDALPVLRRVVNAVVSYAKYIGNTLWPDDLAVIYPYPASLPAWQVLTAASILIAVSVWSIREASRRPYLIVGWLWFLVTLFPVIGLLQVGSQPMADRFTYVPIVGLFVAAAWGAHELAGRWPATRRVGPVVAVVLLLFSASTARAQVLTWRNSVTLWQHAVSATSQNYRAQGSLGHALATDGRLEEAVGHYENALSLRPGYAEARNNLAAALVELGRPAEAVTHYTEVLRLQPDYAAAHNNLGIALARLGKSADAIPHFADALRLEPGRAPVHNNLAAALATEERFADAIQEWSKAIAIDPSHADSWRNLGLTLIAQGMLDDGIVRLTEAIRLRPDDVRSQQGIGMARANQGRIDEALAAFQAALLVGPPDADLYHDVGALLARKGQIDEAVMHFKAALALDPSHEPARRALAIVTKGK